MKNKKQRRITTLLFRGVTNDYMSMVEAALDAGADVNARKGRNRATVLHSAAVFADDYSMIRTLVEAGADVNALDNEGNTPIEAALKYGEFIGNTVIALAELGAKLPSDWESILEKNPLVDSFEKECLQPLASL